MCWSRSIDIFLDNEGDGSSHQHIKQRAQILVTGNISGVVEVWGLYHPFEIYLLSGRSPSASLLLLSLPLSSIFAAISNIKHENVYNTSLDCQVSTLLRLTSITSVSHSSTSSISLILGLSNGMLLRIDLQLSGTPADYNWELLWSRQIFNCSIDGVSVLEVGSCTTLFVVSGQLGTLIPFNRITCSETPHLMNNVVNSGYISYWNHYILSGDTITSFSVVNLPRQLDLSLLEGIEGISLPSHSFSKYCHYVLISSLDGIIRLIPVSGTDTDSNDSIVLFQTTFQISGLSVDPLGLSYSFLVNSNESTAKRYYQAKAHNIIFQPLPWCPIVSLADRPYLESLISSIVNDSSKASCSLTTLYSLISHLLLEFNTMSEAAYQKECFLHPEYRAGIVLFPFMFYK